MGNRERRIRDNYGDQNQLYLPRFGLLAVCLAAMACPLLLLRVLIFRLLLRRLFLY